MFKVSAEVRAALDSAAQLTANAPIDGISLVYGLATTKTFAANRLLTAKITVAELRRAVLETDRPQKTRQMFEDFNLGLSAVNALHDASMTSQSLNQDEISAESLLLALTEDKKTGMLLDHIVGTPIRHWLEYELLRSLRSNDRRSYQTALAVRAPGGPSSSAQGSNLDQFTVDLTKLARENKLPAIIGRIREVNRCIRILGRKTKNNPVLIGEPGVGKTAIAEGIARRIADKDRIPKKLEGKRVLMLDLTLMVAGTKHRGEFEERAAGIIKEVKEAGNIILFIDEIHTLMGAGSASGSAMSAANSFKPALAKGELSTIGATTPAEYKKYFTNDDPASERRFQPVKVAPNTVAETIEILQGIKESYEKFHGVSIDADALVTAAEQTDVFVTGRFLPDKAIDAIDEAASKVASGQADVDRVTTALVLEIISEWTGVPLSRMSADEKERYLNMEATLGKRVISQTEAVRAVSRTARRSRAGLKDPNRPAGVFVFLGPTGVGKTELARALQEFLTGNADDLLRFDMSEYMERHSVSKLIGAPPGYADSAKGGKLTEAVRNRPYRVVLLDEIEKAHPDILNILLQIAEDGILTDGLGNEVSFKQTIVIMTSNIGARQIKKRRLGFQDSAADARVLDEVKAVLSPELYNRIDEIIIFESLSKDDMVTILELMVDKLRQLLAPRRITLKLDESAVALLLEGTDTEYGARPMRRAVQRQLTDELAEYLIADLVKEGDTVWARAHGGKIVFGPNRAETTTVATSDAEMAEA